MESKTTDETCDWLEAFQDRANTLTGSDSLKFTMEIWNPDAPQDEVPRLKKVEIVRKEAFPYLDLEMYWRNDELQFRVHLKENQALKYLNKGSNHTKATFQAIPKGVCRRLVSLTSVNEDNENKTIDELYPEHFKALRRANLISEKDTFPTLRKASDDLEAHIEERNSEERQEKRQRNAKDNKRSVYFCLGVANEFWKGQPASVTIRQLIKKHDLPWLRIKMAHMRFPNLAEMLQADLQSKVMKGISDQEYEDRKCNCQVRSKVNGKCLFGDECRKGMVVYALKDTITDKTYYGKTQRYLKERTGEHLTDVWKVVEANNKNQQYARADAFAKHFANYCQDCTTSNQVKQRLKPIIKPEIVWQGDRIQCMKSSRTRECTICMVERKQIINSLRKNKYKVINDNSDIYSPCKCSSKFQNHA